MKADVTTRPKEILDQAGLHDLDAEKSLLASIFFRQDALDDVSMIVTASDFYDDEHRAIFAALREMHGAGKRIDATLFAADAKRNGTLEKCGGTGLFAEIITVSYTAVHAVHYATIVRELALKRALRHAGTQILQLGADEHGECSDAINSAEQLVMEIRDRHAVSASRAVNVAEILQESMVALDRRSRGEVVAGLPCGFDRLDSLMGFRPSELLILAARPGMGKTALALNIAANIAAVDKQPVIFFSLEMNGLAIADRLLSSWSKVDGDKMRTGRITPAERAAIVEASASLSQSPLVVDDSPAISVQEIAAVCRRQKRRTGLALVVIDYLQLINADNHRDQREQQVARISRLLKGLARELNVPVLCLAQLNRQVESGSDKRPKLSHLRESGAIEQDADVVAFVHRDEYFEVDPVKQEAVKGRAEICVEKSRNGPRGVAKLVWQESIVTFKSEDPQQTYF